MWVRKGAPVNERTDENLVTAALSGERRAYAALVRRHSRRVYAVCMGILGNTADSDDIAQEAFVKGFRSLGTIRGGGSFGPWISQIARNLCRDHIRVSARRRELLEKNLGGPRPAEADYPELHDALAELPEEYRVPLMLFYFDGKSAGRLAEELEISHAGACTRLSRARRELRRILERQAGGR
jgi:RNA polymerase sigma factor (sigma-70 family)